MRSRGDETDLANWPVAILAGGLATRLRPATDKTPKALLNVAGKPFLVHQLQLLHSYGFRNVVLCVGYLGEKIEAELSDGGHLGVRIAYSFDGPNLLGTGGAIRRALPMLGERFVVVYGDSYMPVDYSTIVNAFISSAKPALMTVLENQGRWDVSNVEFERGEIHQYDKKRPTSKMRYIDYGVAVMNAAVFAHYPQSVRFDLAEVYSRLVAEKQMVAYEVKQRFYEIGSREGLAELDSLLSRKSAALL